MSTIIGNLNTQRNANCVVQASQLNGGNLSQSFNLQAMRMVKGTVSLNWSVNNQESGDGNVLVNEYDGSAVELGPADVIVAAVVENGSGSDQGSVGYLPLAATGGSTLGVILTYGALPSFNPGMNSWVAGATGAAISNTLTLASLNTGIRFTPIVNSTSSQMKYWINCVPNGNTVFTSLNPVLNVTLLVLNPSLAM
jgi:hypothetical protein